jgi:hypothetical protein
MLKTLTSACACAVLVLMTFGTAQAQTLERTTFFTFTDTIMLPGMTLPAATWYPRDVVGWEFVYSDDEQMQTAGLRDASAPMIGTK